MNAKENGNYSAYPTNTSLSDGLTKREAMAMMADVPWNAVADTMEAQSVKPEGTNKHFTVEQFLRSRAKIMVLQADALLEQLSK